MDWPQLSSIMTPTDGKENNSELLTPQTEKQLQLDTDNDNIRLKPLEPTLPESLPASTKSLVNHSDNIGDKGDSDMVVNLADIGGAISVDDGMCSVDDDKFDIKDDLNLLKEQISCPNDNDDVVVKDEREDNVPNEDLVKDLLTGPIEENKELKSICEIITSNSSLTSIVPSNYFSNNLANSLRSELTVSNPKSSDDIESAPSEASEFNKELFKVGDCDETLSCKSDFEKVEDKSEQASLINEEVPSNISNELPASEVSEEKIPDEMTDETEPINNVNLCNSDHDTCSSVNCETDPSLAQNDSIERTPLCSPPSDSQEPEDKNPESQIVCKEEIDIEDFTEDIKLEEDCIELKSEGFDNTLPDDNEEFLKETIEEPESVDSCPENNHTADLISDSNTDELKVANGDSDSRNSSTVPETNDMDELVNNETLSCQIKLEDNLLMSVNNDDMGSKIENLASSEEVTDKIIIDSQQHLNDSKYIAEVVDSESSLSNLVPENVESLDEMPSSIQVSPISNDFVSANTSNNECVSTINSVNITDSIDSRRDNSGNFVNSPETLQESLGVSDKPLGQKLTEKEVDSPISNESSPDKGEITSKVIDKSDSCGGSDLVESCKDNENVETSKDESDSVKTQKDHGDSVQTRKDLVQTCTSDDDCILIQSGGGEESITSRPKSEISEKPVEQSCLLSDTENMTSCLPALSTSSTTKDKDAISEPSTEKEIISTVPTDNKLLTTGDNNKEISEAVKFFFQKGNTNLDKFFGPNLSSLPTNPAAVANKIASSDSETGINPKTNSNEEPESVPLAFIPETIIDSSGRKLPPILPKIPVAFYISDVRSLQPSSVSSPELKPVASGSSHTELSGGNSVTTTSVTAPAPTVVSVNTAFNKDGSVVQQAQRLQPKQRVPPKKINRVRQIQQPKLKKNQLSPALFSQLNTVLPTASGFVTTNLGNGNVNDVKSYEQLLLNDQRMLQSNAKGQPRVKGVKQRARVSTSVVDESIKCTNMGGGICGTRLQSVVNKLHQAIDPNSAAVKPNDNNSILHNLLLSSKDKASDRSGLGTPPIQCLKVVESAPNVQNNIITTFRIPSGLTIIPQTVVDKQKSSDSSLSNVMEPRRDVVSDSVVNRLKKLGTIIEVEREPQCISVTTPTSSLPPPPPLTPISMTKQLNQQTDLPNSAGAPNITAQCLKMLESLAQTENLVTNVPKRKPQKKRIPNPDVTKNKKELGKPPELHLIKSFKVLPISTPKTSSSCQTINSSTECNKTSFVPTDNNKTVPSKDSVDRVVNVVESKCASVVETKPETKQNVEPKFVFQIDSSQVLNLPNGQRMLTCNICDGVYHKTMSLKKHYMRMHINQKYLSERDQLVCGMIQLVDEKTVPPKKLTKISIGDLSNWVNTSMPGLFRCFTCGACFDQKNELKTHLVEHPPVSLMKIKEGKLETFMCSGCSKTFAKKKLFVQHRKICDQKTAGLLLNQHCLYCDKSFLTIAARNKHHFKAHHPKRKYQPCFVCKAAKFKDNSTLFKHMCVQHKDKYFGCLNCKIRYLTKTELVAHNKENHARKKNLQSEVKSEGNEVTKNSEEKPKKNADPGSKHKCSVCGKAFGSELNVSRHHRLAHGVHPRRKHTAATKTEAETKKEPKDNKDPNEKVKSSSQESEKPPQPPPPPPPPPVMDPETLFYSRIAINIRENLLHHLDGKLDSQEVLEYDLNTPAGQASKNKLMNFSASFTSSRGSIDCDSIMDSKQSSNPVSPKVPWEKFSFPKNYDGRCGLTSYIKDMSHLDISTQLTMRRNLQRLNSTVESDPTPDTLADIPAGLSLIGSSSSELFGASSDKISEEEKKGAELSGEWTRPRSYVCAVCNLCTTNLWELEDHKMALHPNVWCPHHEVLAEHTSCWELVYNRTMLAPSGVLGSQLSTDISTVSTVTISNRCTKCNKHYPNQADLHRHMLDCGGDTTWMSTMLAVSSPGSSRRNRKWRPFGSRRRRQQGRRGLKRNIPNTPAKQPGMRIRTKPGDTETIQKMIANLPPKRTRRIIGEDGEIKTRSQGTISSVSVVNPPGKHRGTFNKLKKTESSKVKNTNAAVVKGVKEAKNTAVEEKKDILKTTPKKANKAVRKLLTDSPTKKKQEVSSESKSEGTDEKSGKEYDKEERVKRKSTTLNETVNLEKQLTETKSSKEDNTVVVKEECKEINIVVVSSGKREGKTDVPSKANENVVSILISKQVKNENTEKTTVKTENTKKKTGTSISLKEDKGINTEVSGNDETSQMVAAVKAASVGFVAETSASPGKVESVSDVSPKRGGKAKKEEMDKKKSEELKSKICMEGKLIICNGCGMQFDSASACQRHMKTCVYWKEQKVSETEVDNANTQSHTCGMCNQTFPYLMALLRHKCESPSEDRTMPELIREEPFEVEQAAPVEISKDIPVLSPEEVRRNTENQADAKMNSKRLVPKNKIKVFSKNFPRRTSSIESIVDTISEVSKETFTLDHFMWVNGSIAQKSKILPRTLKICPTTMACSCACDHSVSTETTLAPIFQDTVTTTTSSTTTSVVADPDITVTSTKSVGSGDSCGISENKEVTDEKKVKEIVVVNSTIKTVPKLVKITSPITRETKMKNKEIAASRKIKKVPITQKSPRGIKRKINKLNKTKRKSMRKALLSKAKKKRSTALEILLRENKLMAESRKPVKTVEKRRSNSPGHEMAKRFRKRRKLMNTAESLSVEFMSESDTGLNSQEDEYDDTLKEIVFEKNASDCEVTDQSNLLKQSEEFSTKADSIEDTKEVGDEGFFSNKSETEVLGEKKETSLKTDISSSHDPSNQSSKNSTRSPKKLKLQSDETLIITGTRRKTNAINRWDMYRPSCSNGKVYCEPCNREVKEDGMAKHEQSGLHVKNINLKNFFDSLFPDPYKFSTNCDHCSWKFPTPFTCYKHYLQKHEDLLSEIIDKVMAEKDVEGNIKNREGAVIKGENSADESDTCIKEESTISQNKIVSIISEKGTSAADKVKDKDKSVNPVEIDKFKVSWLKCESVSGDFTKSPETSKTENDFLYDNQLKPETIQPTSNKEIKQECLNNKLVYCDVCNKGVKAETMSKHVQSFTHKKNVNLKKEFDMKIPDDKKNLFPVYCEKCNWHFTSPFLCYKHYFGKHCLDPSDLIEKIRSKIISDDESNERLVVNCNAPEVAVQKVEVLDLPSTGNLDCERLTENVTDCNNATTIPPTHLHCRICCKKVKFDLTVKHVNTSLHKQNLESWTESVSLPSQCKWCRIVDKGPFSCYDHYGDISEPTSVGTMRKKRKKKKNFVKGKEQDFEDSDNEKLSSVKRGKVMKKRKKIKFKKLLSDKLQNILKDNLPLKCDTSEKAIEMRTDVSVKVPSEKMLKKRKKRFKFRQIRNDWKVSVVDPGLATMSDSSSNDVKLEVKTESVESGPVASSETATGTVTSRLVPPAATATSAPAATERRSSVGGSEFYCLLCQKQFSSAILLVQHQSSPMHKFNESQNIRPLRKLQSRNGETTQIRRSESPITTIKREPTSSTNTKPKDLSGGTPISNADSESVHNFPGQEINQEWIDSNRLSNVDQRENIVGEELGPVQHQDWTHDWVMSGSNNAISQWDVNNSVTSQLWDNSDNSLMNAAGCSSSLGSILDSVNKILADDGDASLLPQYSLAELQSAMGASDEEMAMLQQLGERSFNDEFMYDGTGSVCSHNEQWSMSGSAPGSVGDDNTTTLMDLDNQQPPPPPVPLQPSQLPSSVSAPSGTATSSCVSGDSPANLKTEPVDFCDNVDKGSCRGLMGRPRRLLSDYESREMVCPSCGKHFLGLSALQSHLAWSQCSAHTASSNNPRSNMWLKRRALLNRSDDVDRRLVCYICKEIFNCPNALDKHVASHNVKKEAQLQSSNLNSDCSDGAEKLKNKMSSALGGLLDRALNNLLCSKGHSLSQSGQEGGPELSSGTIQLLGKLCAVRRRTEQGLQCRPDGNREKSYNSALATELRQLISRGKSKIENPNPGSSNTSSSSPSTTLDHLALVLGNGQEQRPYACPICDDRFLIPSTRNKHIARAHGKYGRRVDTEDDNESNEQSNPADSNHEEVEQDWRDAACASYDSDAEDGHENDSEVQPLCSDCGLSFPSMSEVSKHRKEFHTPQPVKENDLPVSENIVDSTSGEGKRRSGRRATRSVGKQSKVGQVGSSKPQTQTRRRQRNASKKSKKVVSTEIKESDDSTSEEIKPKVEIEREEAEDGGVEGEEDREIKSQLDDEDDDDNDSINDDEPLYKLKRRKLAATADDEQFLGKKKGEKRKLRLVDLAQEDVRVKAEAALRELNVPKRNRIVSSSSKWGVETLKFTKTPNDVLKNATAALARAKLSSIMTDSKWKLQNSGSSVSDVKIEPICQSTSDPGRHPDVYDFDDEELGPSKTMLPYGQQRDDKDKRQDDNEKWSFFKEEVDSPLDS